MLLEYKVIDGIDKENFSREVSDYLLRGWELYGNLQMTTYVIASGRVLTRYAQTVTKEFEPQTP